MNPLVSIVTLTHNRKDLLSDLLFALRRQTYDPVEIIVVDNASSDNTVSVVKTRFPEVKLVRSPRNIGTAAYNLGMAEASGEYILLMDDDGRPSRDWVTQMVARFQANPQLGAAACMIRLHATGEVADDSPRFVLTDAVDGGYPCAAYNGTGAGLRAAALRSAGYYPEDYFLSWIELYLCTRILDNGWEVRCYPDIVVEHFKEPGGSYRPMTYNGLRNYYWYVWTFYPGLHAVTETMRYLGGQMKKVLRGRLAFGLLARATVDAIRSFPKVLQQRSPISSGTLRTLCHIRKHGIRDPQQAGRHRKGKAQGRR